MIRSVLPSCTQVTQIIRNLIDQQSPGHVHRVHDCRWRKNRVHKKIGSFPEEQCREHYSPEETPAGSCSFPESFCNIPICPRRTPIDESPRDSDSMRQAGCLLRAARSPGCAPEATALLEAGRRNISGLRTAAAGGLLCGQWSLVRGGSRQAKGHWHAHRRRIAGVPGEHVAGNTRCPRQEPAFRAARLASAMLPRPSGFARASPRGIAQARGDSRSSAGRTSTHRRTPSEKARTGPARAALRRAFATPGKHAARAQDPAYRI